MDRLTVIFPSDDPMAGKVCPEYESEYLGCVSSECFDVAFYNENGFLHGDSLVVVPPAPRKRVYCLLRGLPARRYAKPYTSIDFAMTESGDWRVARFFDAQSSDLPPTMDPRRYYEMLAAYVSEAPMVPEWAWCMVGDIVDENVIGEEHKVVHGTRHFAPDTKVYCACELGGNGWERICVLGVPRYSENLVSMIVPATKIRNFRLEKVYDNRIIEVMTNGWLGDAFCSINPTQIGFGWSNSDEDRRVIERLVESFKVWPWITGEKT